MTGRREQKKKKPSVTRRRVTDLTVTGAVVVAPVEPRCDRFVAEVATGGEREVGRVSRVADASLGPRREKCDRKHSNHQVKHDAKSPLLREIFEDARRAAQVMVVCPTVLKPRLHSCPRAYRCLGAVVFFFGRSRRRGAESGPFRCGSTTPAPSSLRRVSIKKRHRPS
jgi:hypothetical protein